MDSLSIRLLGTFELRRGARRLGAFPTQISRSIFTYLVLNRGRMVSREALAGLFWAERPDAVARKCLRTEVWRIRSTLESEDPDGGRCLVVRDHQVGFDAAVEHWVDVDEFEGCVGGGARKAAGVGEQELARLERAVELYRGDLLEGSYDSWCVDEQERLRLLFLRALERLMAHYGAAGEWEGAIGAGRRLLVHDPFREHVHRELILFHYRMGDRPAALRQYERCARLLREELEVEPMVETRRLYEAVLAQSVPAVGPRAGAEPAPAYSPLPAGVVALPLATLLRARTELDEARAQLERSIVRLEGMGAPPAARP